MRGSDRLSADVSRRLQRERDFHERLARELDPDTLAGPAAGELDDALLARVGSLRGRRVLELGCGSGDLTLLLLQRGAVLTALDISPGMVAVARRRAQRLLPYAECRWLVAPAERTGLPSESFDLAVGRFILHHVDLAAAAAELARVLRPGGRAVLLENSGRNRVLMLARNHITGRFGIPRLGSSDERPLSAADVQLLRDSFERVKLRYPVFEFLALFDRQVLRFRFKTASRLLWGADRLVGRAVPGLRRYSFRVLVDVSRPRST